MIEFKQVSKFYHGKAVVKNLDFQIGKGEFFILAGSSGSGKSTTLKMLNRLIEKDEGQIFIGGKDICGLDLRQLRLNTGYVLQQIALFPNLSVRENIELIPELKKWDKKERLEKIRQLLEKAGLSPEHYLNRLPRELSGGEQQRVGILRAIIGEPDILLMDEPFSALDPLSRKQLQNLIKTLQQEYKNTVVFVTHDMQEARLLGDRIAVMNQGEIVQIGTPDELQNKPDSQFIIDFFRQ